MPKQKPVEVSMRISAQLKKYAFHSILVVNGHEEAHITEATVGCYVAYPRYGAGTTFNSFAMGSTLDECARNALSVVISAFDFFKL